MLRVDYQELFSITSSHDLSERQEEFGSGLQATRGSRPEMDEGQS